MSLCNSLSRGGPYESESVEFGVNSHSSIRFSLCINVNKFTCDEVSKPTLKNPERPKNGPIVPHLEREL